MTQEERKLIVKNLRAIIDAYENEEELYIIISKDGNTKHRIVKIEDERFYYGGLSAPIKFIKEHYTLENGEEI
jgi:hypothetical protein